MNTDIEIVDAAIAGLLASSLIDKPVLPLELGRCGIVAEQMSTARFI
jgi:hypothetical protein